MCRTRQVSFLASTSVALLGVSLPARAQLINGSFEVARFSPGNASYDIVDASQIPGWRTTATDNKIEIWSDSFQGVTSYLGDQHAELNANEVSTLFQDVAGLPMNGVLGFEFAHRGRDGVDTLRLTITDLGIDSALGGGDDTVLFTDVYSDGNTAWGFHTNAGQPPIIALGNTTRFAYESVSAAGGNAAIGNFLDAANFGVGVGASAITPEPGSASLLAFGLLPLVGLVRRRKK